MIPRRPIEALLIAALLLPLAAGALESDGDQPVNIEADNAVMDDTEGVAVYEGEVVVTQGSIRILADKLTVYMDDDKALQRVTAFGNPAEFRQLPDDAEEYIRANAKFMEYLEPQDLLNLKTEAVINQGKDRFSGDKITYNTKLHRVTARGSKEKDKRVRITFQPGKKGDGDKKE
ncbi:MAG: lipopolysaccharide transport periplasmic protein LptA [Gammaproteobacteria bacterium]|nr:lipopolysaccharide transport periplasmic protein LptA [Gammaproteobacteria bacterium]